MTLSQWWYNKRHNDPGWGIVYQASHVPSSIWYKLYFKYWVDPMIWLRLKLGLSRMQDDTRIKRFIKKIKRAWN